MCIVNPLLADRSSMLKPGQALILVVIALLTFGVVMVNSAGLRVSSDNAIDWQSVIFSRATIYAVIAVGMLLVGSCIPSQMLCSGVGWRSPIPWLVVIMILGLLVVHLPGLERNVNGSSRWINIAGLSIQPCKESSGQMITTQDLRVDYDGLTAVSDLTRIY